MLPHGTKLWAIFCNRGPVCQVNRAFDMLEASSAEFLPYWKWRDVNSSLNGQEVYVTMYIQADKALLAISNLSGQDKPVSLKRSLIEKALHKRIDSAADPVDNQSTSLNASELTVDVKSKDFRLIMLNLQKSEKKSKN